MKKKNIILLILTIAFLVTLVVSATYAYFAGSSSQSNATFNTALPNKGIFTSYSTDPLAFSLDAQDFDSASTTAKKTDNGNIIVDFISNNSNELHCTYDIRLVWDSTDQYISPSMTLPSNGYNYELSILGSRANSDSTSGHSYENKNLSEINLTNLNWEGTAGTIGRYATLVSGAEIYNKSITISSRTTWTFTMKFYVLPSDQDIFENKNFAMHLQVANIVC